MQGMRLRAILETFWQEPTCLYKAILFAWLTQRKPWVDTMWRCARGIYQ